MRWSYRIAFVLTWAVATTQAQSMNEYKIKAVFLYNFAKFVEWPAEAFQSPNQPIEICILGQDPFGNWLEETVQGRAIDGRALEIRSVVNIKEMGGCHVVFVSLGGQKRFRSLLSEMNKRSVLTVGESDNPSKSDADINLMRQGTRVRFEINAEAAKQKHLRISSKLLALASSITK